MHVLGDRWMDGFLDYHRPPDQLRIAVRVWWPLRSLRGVFVEQPRSIRRVLNYLREVGLRAVVQKIRSRRAELLRNQRVIAIGLGEVIEAPPDSSVAEGASVLFIAPCHPKCVERVVLPPECVRATPDRLLKRSGVSDGIRYVDRARASASFDPSLIAGWSPYSGAPIADGASSMLDWAERTFEALDPHAGRVLPLPSPSTIKERMAGTDTAIRRSIARQATAVLFGLGHYAKTCLIPNLDPRIELRCIHEIEPTQIGRIPSLSVAYDSSPTWRDDENYDVYFIAGYHHTHADLAVRALNRGATAVVEKPIVTSRDQLARVREALTSSSGRLFACYHMRYNPLWFLAREDLGVRTGEPIHYSCIVYEIPLGTAHWYNWPKSGSRLISNGCHWLDHFLFMNNFSEVNRQRVWRGGNGDLHCSVELRNGAVMSMCLTDIGSPRIGVQEHVELRAGSVTVKVDNASRYEAEDAHRIIRRKRTNKMRIYGRMYQIICRRILDGRPGDSVESITQSAALTLDLETMLQQHLRSVDTSPGCSPRPPRDQVISTEGP